MSEGSSALVWQCVHCYKVLPGVSPGYFPYCPFCSCPQQPPQRPPCVNPNCREQLFTPTAEFCHKCNAPQRPLFVNPNCREQLFTPTAEFCHKCNAPQRQQQTTPPGPYFLDDKQLSTQKGPSQPPSTTLGLQRPTEGHGNRTTTGGSFQGGSFQGGSGDTNNEKFFDAQSVLPQHQTAGHPPPSFHYGDPPPSSQSQGYRYPQVLGVQLQHGGHRGPSQGAGVPPHVPHGQLPYYSQPQLPPGSQWVWSLSSQSQGYGHPQGVGVQQQRFPPLMGPTTAEMVHGQILSSPRRPLSLSSPYPPPPPQPPPSQPTSLPLRQATPTYNISGAGVETATVKTCSQFSIEVLYSQGGPCSSSQCVTAELKSMTSSSVTKAKVVQKSPSTYEVTYTPTTRGRHELCVRVNSDEIHGSPFRVVVLYPDPTQLRQPMRVIEVVAGPWGVAFNSHGELYVTMFSYDYDQVAALDSSGKRISTIGSRGHGPGQFQWPFYIAIDSNDNVYVTSRHKLQKLDRNGKFVKSVGSGSRGGKSGEFNDPRWIKVHQNQVYVCDRDNNRIQVFDLELTFITFFGTKGSGQGEYDRPSALDFDSQGNIYVSECGNHRVQVLDPNGRYLRQFGDESGPGKLKEPEGCTQLCICIRL